MATPSLQSPPGGVLANSSAAAAAVVSTVRNVTEIRAPNPSSAAYIPYITDNRVSDAQLTTSCATAHAQRMLCAACAPRAELQESSAATLLRATIPAQVMAERGVRMHMFFCILCATTLGVSKALPPPTGASEHAVCLHPQHLGCAFLLYASVPCGGITDGIDHCDACAPVDEPHCHHQGGTATSTGLEELLVRARARTAPPVLPGQ
jgi:hypothetical protein